MFRGTAPVDGFGRRGVRSIPAGAVLLLMVLMCLSQVPSAKGAASSTSSTTTTSTSSIPVNALGAVSIDKQLFATQVPSYAVLGENYTLMVVIQSSVNITVPIIVQVSTPVTAIFVHPKAVRMDVPPMGSMVANFTILAFGTLRSGPFNVTALLYVFFPLSMSSPQLVDQASGIVSTIGPNPFPYLEVVLISGVAVTLILVAVFYPDVFRKGIAVFSK